MSFLKDGKLAGYLVPSHSPQFKGDVVGDVHTNTVEGFWSLVKRGIGGVYHSVAQKYLQTYLDKYSFRYNRWRPTESPVPFSRLRD